ncbi:MAG: hypothetical protein FJ011_22115 [Chloroflexi bacterium]|nr:hypothetical protein [Chloroflexota bacterium]
MGIRRQHRFRIQRHLLARDDQPRLEAAAQVSKRLAQVVLGIDVGHLAPQEAGQVIAALAAAGHGQVGQQRRYLGRHEAGHRRAVHRHAQAAEQTNF